MHVSLSEKWFALEIDANFKLSKKNKGNYEKPLKKKMLVPNKSFSYDTCCRIDCIP